MPDGESPGIHPANDDSFSMINDDKDEKLECQSQGYIKENGLEGIE